MVRNKPWQFFIFKFIADDGKHIVSTGAISREDAISGIMDMYSNVRALREITRVVKE
jgi:hypothetical protein